ncbi:MAG TPA: hypothetical protein VFE63_06040 [Roseiarcus sp.]|nr:hypothetical protein [Roseiarcus sp.]
MATEQEVRFRPNDLSEVAEHISAARRLGDLRVFRPAIGSARRARMALGHGAKILLDERRCNVLCLFEENMHSFFGEPYGRRAADETNRGGKIFRLDCS